MDISLSHRHSKCFAFSTSSISGTGIRTAMLLLACYLMVACSSGADLADAPVQSPNDAPGTDGQPSSNPSNDVGSDPDGESTPTTVAGDAVDPDALQLTSLSGRANTISGGDALVQLSVSTVIDRATLAVSLNGTVVTDRFLSTAEQGRLTALLAGLQDGNNELVATADGAGTSSLTLVNHPVSGPVISGPQEQPFFCQTEEFEIYPGGPTLGQSLDANCSVESRVDYVYLSSAGFLPFDRSQALPADAASITTNEGNVLPYVVRLETGTINRAIYQTAILDDLSAEGPSLSVRDPGWNGRLVYAFGGGCRGGWHRQGNETGGVLNDIMLSQGYATASATLNVFGHNCNDLLAAETMMMVKERFIETYGAPRYTIGRGCSGGAYQVHQIGDNYPGLLDGILPECSFPDVGFATTNTLTDARLLHHYFSDTTGLEWSDEQRRAVSGFGSVGSIANLANGAARIDPVPSRSDGRASAEFDEVVSAETQYNPITNPTGARATIYDHTINAYGRDPATGFARRPLDNVGIQYGLQALNDASISPAQFVELNERIGGFDNDANYTAQRTVADPEAITNAYRSGRLLNGGGGLASMPIIDYDFFYTDLEANGDIHMRYHHFSTRARLQKANGHSNNHVMLTGGGNFDELATDGQRFNNIQRASLARMDEWLANIDADTADGSAIERTLRNKPADLVDGCFTRDGTNRFIAEQQVFGGVGTSACNDLYPAFPPPRQVAGGPLANDIIKCQLRPVAFEDYSASFSPEEQTRLVAAFPEGVCDWAQPGVGQAGLEATWLTFTDVGNFEALD